MPRPACGRRGPADAPVVRRLPAHCFRWGAAPPDPRYAALAKQLAPQPQLSVPATVLHGERASLVASSEGKEGCFTGPYARRVLAGAGHCVPREPPPRWWQC